MMVQVGVPSTLVSILIAHPESLEVERIRTRSLMLLAAMLRCPATRSSAAAAMHEAKLLEDLPRVCRDPHDESAVLSAMFVLHTLMAFAHQENKARETDLSSAPAALRDDSGGGGGGRRGGDTTSGGSGSLVLCPPEVLRGVVLSAFDSQLATSELVISQVLNTLSTILGQSNPRQKRCLATKFDTLQRCLQVLEIATASATAWNRRVLFSTQYAWVHTPYFKPQNFLRTPAPPSRHPATPCNTRQHPATPGNTPITTPRVASQCL